MTAKDDFLLSMRMTPRTVLSKREKELKAVYTRGCMY